MNLYSLSLGNRNHEFTLHTDVSTSKSLVRLRCFTTNLSIFFKITNNNIIIVVITVHINSDVTGVTAIVLGIFAVLVMSEFVLCYRDKSN